MSSSILRAFLLVSVLNILFINTNGQSLYPLISAELANQRLSQFKMYKSDVFEEIPNGTRQDLSFAIDKNEFKQMIHNFSNIRYSGFRLYFANFNLLGDPNGRKKNQLTVVFVPTIKVNKKQLNVDSNYYYFAYDGTLFKLKKVANENEIKKIQSEIRKYQFGQLPYLEQSADNDEDLDLSNFHETKSIWYDIDILNHNKDGYIGLDIYLQNKDLFDKIKELKIDFTARKLDEQYEHHMDVVYEFITKDSLKYFSSFNNNDIKQFQQIDVLAKIKKLNDEYYNLVQNNKDKPISSYFDKFTDYKNRMDSLIRQLSATYTDTGIPCPPRICN